MTLEQEFELIKQNEEIQKISKQEDYYFYEYYEVTDIKYNFFKLEELFNYYQHLNKRKLGIYYSTSYELNEHVKNQTEKFKLNVETIRIDEYKFIYVVKLTKTEYALWQLKYN